MSGSVQSDSLPLEYEAPFTRPRERPGLTQTELAILVWSCSSAGVRILEKHT
jgi:hypothetical protein